MLGDYYSLIFCEFFVKKKNLYINKGFQATLVNKAVKKFFFFKVGAIFPGFKIPLTLFLGILIF